jgi:hypothetical protein
MEMCEIMHGEKYGEALKTISLSKNTVMRRTKLVPEDIEEQLETRITCSPKFALRIDESADVAGFPQLHSLDIVSKKSSKNSSCSGHRFQRDVQGLIYSRQ